MRIAFAFILAAATLAPSEAARAAGPVERSNPYVSLFRAQLDGMPAPASPSQPVVTPPFPARAAAPSHAPTVVCGMTLVPEDPAADARMLVPVPKSNAKASIRTITPTACGR
jgi:hypothetical protein